LLPIPPSLSAPLALALLGLAFLLLLVIAIGDIRTRIIRNTHVGVLALLFVPFALLVLPDVTTSLYHIGAAFILFVFTFFCFTQKWMGGGDAKLIPAIALWVGPHGIMPFLFSTAIGGSFVALGLIIWQARRKSKDLTQWRKLPLPYGVAIAGGGMLVMGMQYGPALLPAM